jgi:peptidoglycan/xylan/chitin deacetylase (PgdA/CDA1 family)
MSLRHRLKRTLRDLYSRAFVYSGLALLMARCGGPRLLILAGHGVDGAAGSASMPADLKISPARLEGLLRALGRYGEWVTVGEGVTRLDSGHSRGLVALSMDDGYLDNRTQLLPLLEACDARCTVYLEARPLEIRRVSWLHKWFWLERRLGTIEAGRRCALELNGHSAVLNEILAAGADAAARGLKRRLKYDLDAEPRDRAVHAVFEQAGGDEATLCEELYLCIQDARELLESGRVELGGHTWSHEVLTTLESDVAREEIVRGRGTLEELLGADCGESFAYPFGRRWDQSAEHAQAVEAAGYQSAVTTHAGLNLPAGDSFQLKRWMLTDTLPVHLLVTELCGGFDLLRRLGLDLVE